MAPPPRAIRAFHFAMGWSLGVLVVAGLMAPSAIFGLRADLGLAQAQAGDLAGSMLRLAFWFGVVPLPLAFVAWRMSMPEQPPFRTLGRVSFLLFLGAVLGFLSLGVLGAVLHEMRLGAQAAWGGMEFAPPGRRTAFGLLHALSMIGLLGTVAVVAWAWGLSWRSRP